MTRANLLPVHPKRPIVPRIRMDLLSDLLRAVRLSGAVFFRAEFSAPWRVRSDSSERLASLILPRAKHVALFHYIAEGACWADVEGEKRELAPGDVIVLPFGSTHVMGRGNAPKTQEVTSLFPGSPPWPEPPRIVAGGGGEPTRLVCGFLHWDQAVFNPLLDALPKVIVASSSGRPTEALLRTSLDLLASELQGGRPGSESVAGRLSEVLFVDVLRQHAQALGPAGRGWLAALRDPGIRSALEAIHARPQDDWPVDELARRAAMSRSTFYERFTELLGDAPAQYLTRWRLQRAASLLTETSDPLATIGERVGYTSEAAFSRAFKRHTGESPAAFRSARRTSGRSR
jgi:AraC-like DNA-binding protein